MTQKPVADRPPETAGVDRPGDDPGGRPGTRLWEMAKFGLVGGSNAALDFGLFALLHFIVGLSPLVANTISFSTAVVSNFVLHKVWTFSGRGQDRHWAGQLPLFILFNVIALGLSNLTLWLLSPLITPAPAKIVSLFVTYAWNYVTSRRYIYVSKERPES